MMNRLARLLPLRQFGRFRYLRNLHVLQDCNAAGTTALSSHATPLAQTGPAATRLAQGTLGFWPDLQPDPCAELPQASRPAFARLGLRGHREPMPEYGHGQRAQSTPGPFEPAPVPAPQVTLAPTRAGTHGTLQAAPAPDPVRVYRGPSRVTLVGHIDAVCRMLDRCIAQENAGLEGDLFELRA